MSQTQTQMSCAGHRWVQRAQGRSIALSLSALLIVCLSACHTTAQTIQDSSSPQPHALDDELTVTSIPLLTGGVFSAEWSVEAPGQLRHHTPWSYHGKRGSAHRVKHARGRIEAMREVFGAAEVQWPPAEVYLRAFKSEGELELWANSDRGQALRPILTWKLCALSGELGPKRAEGDGQVPEGFYEIAHYNPYSRYHLSMLISYPNRSDRILGDKHAPGSAIMIHGKCASIGCLSISDERIEELWLITEAARGVYPKRRVRAHPIPITIFPSRHLDLLLRDDAYRQHHALWYALRQADLSFTRHKRPPQVTIDQHGVYTVIEPK